MFSLAIAETQQPSLENNKISQFSSFSLDSSCNTYVALLKVHALFFL